MGGGPTGTTERREAEDRREDTGYGYDTGHSDRTFDVCGPAWALLAAAQLLPGCGHRHPAGCLLLSKAMQGARGPGQPPRPA
jgi:hypothetical protein